MDQKRDHRKMILYYFQTQKWMLQSLRVGKVDEKNGYDPVVWFLNCPKKWIFSNFNFKPIKAIYQYASERSRSALSGNDIVYYSITYCFKDITVWTQISLLNFCWVSIFFDDLIANISWTVAQTPKKHIIFWKSAMRTFRCIYANCLHRLSAFTEISTKLQKILFLDNLRTITQEINIETRQMIPFFYPYFPL